MRNCLKRSYSCTLGKFMWNHHIADRRSSLKTDNVFANRFLLVSMATTDKLDFFATVFNPITGQLISGLEWGNYQERNIIVTGPCVHTHTHTHTHSHIHTQPLQTIAKQTIAMSPWRGSPCNSHPANRWLLLVLLVRGWPQHRKMYPR